MTWNLDLDQCYFSPPPPLKTMNVLVFKAQCGMLYYSVVVGCWHSWTCVVKNFLPVIKMLPFVEHTVIFVLCMLQRANAQIALQNNRGVFLGAYQFCGFAEIPAGF